jgi:tRNA-dihydrouridine synthase A
MVCEKPLILFCYLYSGQILAYSPDQHPIVLQIGGSNLENLAKATELADAYGYDEINFKLVCFFC